jgi:glycerol uptake facilitator protein
VTFALAATKRFPWRGVPAYWTAQVAGGIAGALAIWASFGSRVFDFGAGFGVVDFNHDVTSWGSAMFVEALGTAILLFAILGIVDTRSPEGWAGLVIGLTVVAIIITVGPITNASINPARALGPLLVSDLNGSFHNWTEQLFAYIPANLAGAAIAAFVYDWVATPRIVEAPIRAAVTEPDRADAYETPAHV